MLDNPSAKCTSPRLVLLAVRFVASNVEGTATVVEPVLDCLVESHKRSVRCKRRDSIDSDLDGTEFD
jgi:hypothetical protein